MKFSSSWRLPLALAIVTAFVAFAAWPGNDPRDAEATVNSISASAAVGEDGQIVEITVNGTDDSGDLDVTTDSDETFALDSCTTVTPTDCSGAETAAGATYTLDTDNAAVDDTYDLVLDMMLNCSGPEAITVSADDDDNGDSVVVYCVPELNDPHLVVEKDADDNSDYDFDWSATSGDCVLLVEGTFVEFDDDGSFDLDDHDQAEFWCETSVRLFVDEDDDFDFVRIDDCSEGTEGVDDISGSTVEIDISDIDPGDTVFCTWVNRDDFHATPTVVVGPPTSVSIVLTSATIDCGSSTLVQVIPRSASGGPASAGTTLVLTSSLGGTFQPSSTLVSQFPVTLANFLYVAPADVSGTTTITARAGNVQTAVTLQIVCAVATPVTTSAPLQPPSAGDGGLLNSSGTSYLPLALAIAAAAAVLALTVGSRRFAFATNDAADVTPSYTAASSDRPGGFALLASFVMLAIALLARRWR